MAGISAIKDTLTGAFGKIQDELLKRLRTAYRDEADRGYKRLMAAAKDPSRVGKIFTTSVRESAEFYGYSHWIEYDQDGARNAGAKGLPIGGWIDTWEELRAARPFVTVCYIDADGKAKMSYENARDSFIDKNLVKFENVLGHRDDIQSIDVKFGFARGVFEGTLKVGLSNAALIAYISLKFVIRRIPHVTPYYQYPLIFNSCAVDGKKYAAPSEEELRMLLGGLSPEKVAEKKLADAAAAGFCPMSGKPVPAGQKREPRYLACPACRAFVSVQNWKFRKHKTPEAEKKAAASKLTETGYCPMSREKVPADVIATIGPVEGYKDPKAICQSCKQQVRLDSERDWIRDKFLTGEGYPTRMLVTKAKYYKHKVV